MALVCSKCSAENADGALVCRQCGAALPPPGASWSRSLLPDDDHFDPLSAPTLVMQHTAPAALPPIEETTVPMPVRGSGRTLLLGLATGVLIVAAGAWLLRPGDAPAPAAAPATDSASASASGAVSVAPPAPAASPSLTAASAAPPPAAPAVASAPVAVPAAASAAPVQAAASTAPAAASAAVTDTRKRIPAPVARKRAMSAAPAAAPAASAAPAPAEPVAAPPVATVAPARPKTVAELCAAGNLITRGFCEQRECRRAEFMADPVCVKLKDAEQRRLFQQ
jgi:hypothetical protein